MGRWLDAEGKLPKPWLDGYKDEATMVELWDIALAEAIKAKGNIVQWWSGENEAQAGFKVNGGEIGLCWDSTGFNLRADGYGYIAAEGRRLRLEPGRRADEERGQRRAGA